MRSRGAWLSRAEIASKRPRTRGELKKRLEGSWRQRVDWHRYRPFPSRDTPPESPPWCCVSKESQDVLHGEPSAPDDGFAYHYVVIYGYPFDQIFIIHEEGIGCSFDINVSFDYRVFSSSRTSKTKFRYLGRIEKLSFSQ